VTLRVAMLDYEMSNLRSAEKAIERLGCAVAHARTPAQAGEFDAVVLPGDGHFGEAMRRLNDSGLAELVIDASAAGIPVLGICIGLQVMFESSDEAPGVAGLGLLAGSARRLPDDAAKVPHIGWSHVTWRGDCPLAPDEGAPSDFYFLHSYAVVPSDESIVWASAEHGTGSFCAVVGAGNVIGMQFHPEKSSGAGLDLLRRWLGHVTAAVGA
jgi:glutamine amidotransferase